MDRILSAVLIVLSCLAAVPASAEEAIDDSFHQAPPCDPVNDPSSCRSS